MRQLFRKRRIRLNLNSSHSFPKCCRTSSWVMRWRASQPSGLHALSRAAPPSPASLSRSRPIWVTIVAALQKQPATVSVVLLAGAFGSSSRQEPENLESPAHRRGVADGSAKYIAELIVSNCPALRKAQEKISRRVFELLGLTLEAHHDAPLVPDAPSRAASTRKTSKAAATAPSLETRQARALEHARTLPARL
jgi:hypothetical protein